MPPRFCISPSKGLFTPQPIRSRFHLQAGWLRGSVPRIAFRQLSYRECPLFGIALTVIVVPGHEYGPSVHSSRVCVEPAATASTSRHDAVPHFPAVLSAEENPVHEDNRRKCRSEGPKESIEANQHGRCEMEHGTGKKQRYQYARGRYKGYGENDLDCDN
jgi:hypothetical protein